MGDHEAMQTELKAYRAILWGGLIAGTLDILAAFIQAGLRGRSPVRILHAIASGLLGADAFEGGAPTAALGALLHFVIAFGAATVYVVASRKLRVLVERPVLCGLLYGVAVYLFMNFVVLPLSAIPFELSYTPAALATGMLIIMFCVGLPIALIASRYAKGLKEV
jgi:uncharacterized membrane protein YagU involved in acid resistance